MTEKTAGQVWPQQRPGWCPHPHSCEFRIRSQDSLCIGELSAPELHDGLENTHRLCQRGANDDGSWLYAVQWNKGDAWNFRRLIDAAFGFGQSERAVADRRVREAENSSLEKAALHLLKSADPNDPVAVEGARMYAVELRSLKSPTPTGVNEAK